MTYIYIQPAVIDKSMMNNKDLIRQFVDMYIVQCPIDFDKLSESVRSYDCQDIADLAHHMKPTMEYVGATELRVNFEELEALAKNTDNETVIHEKFVALRLKFQTFIQELIHYRGSIS